MKLLFAEAFSTYILKQKTVGWGFQPTVRVKLPNGYFCFYGGYFILYENNYRVIISGATLGNTDIQDALIIDPEGIPIARDTENLKGYQFS